MFKIVTIGIISILSITSCCAIELEEVIAKAIQNSSKIRAQFYQYKGIEKQNKFFSISGFLPEVDFKYQMAQHSIDGTNSGFNSRPLFEMRQRVLNSGGHFANFHRARYLLKLEKARFYRAKQEIALNAVQAYVDVMRAAEMLKLNKHRELVAKEYLSFMQKRFSLSEITGTEVSLAKAKFSSSVSKKIDAEGKLAMAKIAYYHLIGEEYSDLSKIDDSLLPSVPALSECLQLAKNGNLSLQMAIYAKKAAKLGVVVEHSDAMPSVDLNISNVDFSNTTVTFAFNVPILKKSLGVGKAGMDLKKSTYDYYEAAKSVEQMVVNAWNNVSTAKAVIEASREAEEAAALALAGVQEEVRLNLKSTTDLLDTEDALFKARSDLVEARSNHIVGVYSLLFIINGIDF